LRWDVVIVIAIFVLLVAFGVVVLRGL